MKAPLLFLLSLGTFAQTPIFDAADVHVSNSAASAGPCACFRSAGARPVSKREARLARGRTASGNCGTETAIGRKLPG